MTPAEAERERAALRARIDVGPLSTTEWDRLAALIAHDRERAQADPSTAGVLGREQAVQYTELFAASGITDAIPGSMTLDEAGRVFVRSASRGLVNIGALDFRRLLAATADHVDEIEAKRRRPLDEKRRRKDANIARAVELHRAGTSPRRIADLMTAARGRADLPPIAPRTVRGWLATQKRMDRDGSDSP